jgi:hypothetical protein
VIEEMRKWLIAHPHDTEVRHAYLVLLKRYGSAEQIRQVMDETENGLPPIE